MLLTFMPKIVKNMYSVLLANSNEKNSLTVVHLILSYIQSRVYAFVSFDCFTRIYSTSVYIRSAVELPKTVMKMLYNYYFII